MFDKLGADVVQHPTDTAPLSWRPDPAADLETIEAAIVTAAAAADPSLAKIAGHLIVAGDIRIRPALVATCGLMSERGPDALVPLPDDVVQASASIELVRLGTMYHDDVIDGTSTRRGIETVNHRWGDLQAILAGDFLLARASELASELSTEIAELLAETIGWICEGQVRELNSLNDLGRTEVDYSDAIGWKTASLFATACRIGGLVAGLPPEDLDRLSEFGRSYGLAFQILDDVADFATAGDPNHKRGGDVEAGVYTLPVLRYLATENDGRLGGLLSSSEPSNRTQAIDVVASSDAITSSIESAIGHAEEALSIAAKLGTGPATEGLRNAVRDLVQPLSVVN